MVRLFLFSMLHRLQKEQAQDKKQESVCLTVGRHDCRYRNRCDSSIFYCFGDCEPSFAVHPFTPRYAPVKSLQKSRKSSMHRIPCLIR